MIVRTIALSNGQDRNSFVDLQEALWMAAHSDTYSRIAFVGHTKRGRAGVALEMYSGDVIGHKMEPLPEAFVNAVRHVPRTEGRHGLRLLLSGEDVLIGDEHNGTLIRWVGPGLEVFGVGQDSEDPLS